MTNSIHFLGEERLGILDSLVLYPKDSSARFKEYGLAFNKSNKVEGVPPLVNPDLEAVLSLNGPSGILGLIPLGNKYRLTVGRQKQNKKPTLEFEGSEYIEKIFYHFKYAIVFNSYQIKF
jgi:hypothetical protein